MNTRDNVVAVCGSNSSSAQLPGFVAIFDAVTREEIFQERVGALPDSCLFSPDNACLVTANEGEPSDLLVTANDGDPGTPQLVTDPYGSVSQVTT